MMKRWLAPVNKRNDPVAADPRSAPFAVQPLPCSNRLRSAVLAFCYVVATAGSVAAQQRSVAITIDDLPVNATRSDLATWSTVTDALLATLAKERIPAIGFVVESKLYNEGRLDPDRVALLEQWLDAGLELGNHSFSHNSLHQTPLDTYTRDILRGETVTRALLEERGRRPQYFRHPMLHAGRDTLTKRGLREFLVAHGYRIAPVTIDNGDWIFARAYDNALDRQDSVMAQRIRDAYVPYMDTVFGYYERQSQELLGEEPPQVLLLHANRLNADQMPALVAMMRRRRYRFVRLDEAMRHEAYDRPDTYTGPAGITWLHRWAMAEGWRGERFRGEPEVPAFVVREAGVGG